MRTKNVILDIQMQVFISTIIELKSANNYNEIEKLLRKKDVSQDHKLQASIPKIIELKMKVILI